MTGLLAFSRRQFVKFIAAVGRLSPGSAAACCGGTARGGEKHARDELLLTRPCMNCWPATERFSSGRPNNPRRTPADFRQLAEGQHPFAMIIGCADSRVASEILFDVGKGDVFVVRVAGNVVNGAGPIVKGSIEYAVAELNVPLIMVLGHSNCGAVKAAMEHLDAKDSLPGAINDLVELIKPAVAESKGEPGNKL